MKDHMTIDAHGQLITPDTVRLQRLLPGPIERVWAYLTEEDLRSKWLAAGVMTQEEGTAFTLTWRNSELTDPPGTPPEGMGGEHSIESRITEFDPPHRLAFTWDGTGGVTFDLEPQGRDVMLTVTHRKVERRGLLVGVSAGWHTHLDLLAARLSEDAPEPFWDAHRRLRAEYETRIPE